ncbi:MAG TPA: hypothetical protein VFL17_10395 [Anaerolineae bacterium]|nr:hypothetical protein [Anaerolineae bacterium]
MSDGLTVPPCTRGRTPLASSTAIVLTGSLAEIAAGSIAMGLSGYLAAWRGQRISGFSQTLMLSGCRLYSAKLQTK